jgi:AhpD family alkylhydroperoxidase
MTDVTYGTPPAEQRAGWSARAIRITLRRLSLLQIHYVPAVPFRSPEPTVARVYRDLEAEFGVLAPPVILHAAVPELLAASWMMLRESLIVPGAVQRTTKEQVAVIISEANACPFCVTVHSSILTSLVGSRARAVPPGGEATGDPATGDPAISDWARASTVRPTAGEGTALPAEHAAELVGVAVMMQYLNRMVNVFLGEAPLPPKAPRRSLRVVSPMLTWLQRSAQSGTPLPGRSLDLLPAEGVSPGPAWSRGNTVIEQTFQRAERAIDRAAEQSISPGVRELLRARLADWDGRPMGINRSWVEDAVSTLPPPERAAGRLALLVAFASYQIDAAVIEEFRSAHPVNPPLLELAAWASLTTALEIGSWMRISGPAADFAPRR